MYRPLTKTITGINGNSQYVSYEYDLLGNKTETVDENGTTVYTCDRLGNVLTETTGTLVKTYAYDDNVNRISADISNDDFEHSLGQMGTYIFGQLFFPIILLVDILRTSPNVPYMFSRRMNHKNKIENFLIIAACIFASLFIYGYYQFFVRDISVTNEFLSLSNDSSTGTHAYFNGNSVYYISNNTLYKDDTHLLEFEGNSPTIFADNKGIYISVDKKLYSLNPDGNLQLFMRQIQPLFIYDNYIFALFSGGEVSDFLKINRETKEIINISATLFSDPTTNIITARKDSEGYTYLFLNDNAPYSPPSISCVLNPSGEIIFTDKRQHCKHTAILYSYGNNVAFSDINRCCVNICNLETNSVKQITIPNDYIYTPGKTFYKDKHLYVAAEKYEPENKTNEKYHKGDIIYKIDMSNMTGTTVFTTNDHIVGFDNMVVWTYDGVKCLKKMNYIHKNTLSKQTIRRESDDMIFEAIDGYICVIIDNKIVKILGDTE